MLGYAGTTEKGNDTATSATSHIVNLELITFQTNSSICYPEEPEVVVAIIKPEPVTEEEETNPVVIPILIAVAVTIITLITCCTVIVLFAICAIRCCTRQVPKNATKQGDMSERALLGEDLEMQSQLPVTLDPDMICEILAN